MEVPGSRPTRKRRKPAAAARILASGLATSDRSAGSTSSRSGLFQLQHEAPASSASSATENGFDCHSARPSISAVSVRDVPPMSSLPGLIRRGAVSACVSLGGDIRVAGGVPEDGGWSIPVDDPHDCSRHLGRVLTADASIVTSTTEFRAWTRDGRTMHHLIDPRTGMPADTGVLAVVVTAPQAWLAEGFAKAALIAGRVAGRRMLDAAGIGGWIIGNDRSCTATEWAPAMTKPASARPTVTLTY